jgi:hypothetical protein
MLRSMLMIGVMPLPLRAICDNAPGRRGSRMCPGRDQPGHSLRPRRPDVLPRRIVIPRAAAFPAARRPANGGHSRSKSPLRPRAGSPNGTRLDSALLTGPPAPAPPGEGATPRAVRRHPFHAERPRRPHDSFRREAPTCCRAAWCRVQARRTGASPELRCVGIRPILRGVVTALLSATRAAEPSVQLKPLVVASSRRRVLAAFLLTIGQAAPRSDVAWLEQKTKTSDQDGHSARRPYRLNGAGPGPVRSSVGSRHSPKACMLRGS